MKLKQTRYSFVKITVLKKKMYINTVITAFYIRKYDIFEFEYL